MSCQDDAQLIGPAALFCGVETWDWAMQQFLDLADFCLQHGITSLFVKAFEVGSKAGLAGLGVWYGGYAGFDVIYQELSKKLTVIPYGFVYGNGDVTPDVQVAAHLLKTYQKICLDIEGSTWVGEGVASKAKQFADALAPIPGRVWLSHPANFLPSHQSAMMAGFSPCVNVYVPMAYNKFQVSEYRKELLAFQPNACIQPTLDLSQEFGANDVIGAARQFRQDGCLAMSIWFEGFARDNPALVDQVIQAFGGAAPPAPIEGDSMQLNGNGCVCDTTRWYQIEREQRSDVPGSPQGKIESPDLCGPGGVIVAALSNEPNGGRLKLNGVEVDAEYIDRATDDMVDAWGKAHGRQFDHITWPGSDDSDMLWFLNYARDTYQRTHYQIIGSPTIDKIRATVRAGYPVLYSCNEQDVQEKRTGARPPYPWNISAGHILLVTGIDKDGDFICPDILNDGFQGYWPVVYVAGTLAHSLSWACIIKLPFLKDIPSGNPLDAAWKGWNAQNMTPPPPAPVPPGPDYTRLDFEAEWRTLVADADVTTGFAKDAYANFRMQKFCGPCITKEVDRKSWGGHPKKVQYTAGGKYELEDGKLRFYPYRA